MPTDLRIAAKFSVWKLLVFCGFIVALAALCWMQIPGLGDYNGNRYSTESGRFLLLSATMIATAFLPLVAWHGWNFFTRPAALYSTDGRLFFYWAFFRSIAIEDITDAIDLGRSGLFGDGVRVSLRGKPDVTFQTTFMARSGSDVVAAIKGIAAGQT